MNIRLGHDLSWYEQGSRLFFLLKSSIYAPDPLSVTRDLASHLYLLQVASVQYAFIPRCQFFYRSDDGNFFLFNGTFQATEPVMRL